MTPTVPKQLALEAIRLERKGGETLGSLVDRYGASLVVEALGVKYVAWSLGISGEHNAEKEHDSE